MKKQDEKVNSLLQLILEANHYIETSTREEIDKDNLFLFQDIGDAVRTINFTLFHIHSLEDNKVDDLANKVLHQSQGIEEYLSEFTAWHSIIKQTLEERSRYNTKADIEFYSMTDYICHAQYEDLLRDAIDNLKQMQVQNKEQVKKIEEYYAFYRHYWGGLLIEKEYYKVLENRIGIFKEHLSDFIWLYEELADYRSKMVLSGILRNWLSFDEGILFKIKETNYADYFDLDLIQCDKEEVFVDLGAYTGDSTLSYLNTYGVYKKIYCYEITPESIEKMKESLKEYSDIEICKKGVSSQKELLYLNRVGKTGAANQIDLQGEIPISVVTLDGDIKEKITFIKMDIEGAEQEALLGCKRHIEEEHPKLAICTYHNNEDIWKIPRMIKEMHPDYKLYMRYYGNQLGPVDYVLFAL